MKKTVEMLNKAQKSLGVCLVTGGTGFLGSFITEKLVKLVKNIHSSCTVVKKLMLYFFVGNSLDISWINGSSCCRC